MTRRNKKLLDIVFDIYRELYANSEPKGDFDELVANASMTEDGKKIIPFDDYEIYDDLMYDIVQKHLSSHKLSKIEKKKIQVEVYLGCSPKSKRRNGKTNI